MRASVPRTCSLLIFLVLACSGCKSYIYVASPWPRLELPDNRKISVSYSRQDLDPLGAEKKAQVQAETMALVAYIVALEETVKAYNDEAIKHNEKFKEKVIKKETSP